jgi:hypothetical protein
MAEHDITDFAFVEADVHPRNLDGPANFVDAQSINSSAAH